MDAVKIRLNESNIGGFQINFLDHRRLFEESKAAFGKPEILPEEGFSLGTIIRISMLFHRSKEKLYNYTVVLKKDSKKCFKTSSFILYIKH